MELIERLHERLLVALAIQGAPLAPLTIGDLYQKLIPYRGVRRELGILELAEYEHALLRLLGGEGRLLEVDDPLASTEIQRELASVNPILGIYRDYAGVNVRLIQTRPKPRAGASVAGKSPPAQSAPDQSGTGPAPNATAPATTPPDRGQAVTSETAGVAPTRRNGPASAPPGERSIQRPGSDAPGRAGTPGRALPASGNPPGRSEARPVGGGAPRSQLTGAPLAPRPFPAPPDLPPLPSTLNASRSGNASSRNSTPSPTPPQTAGGSPAAGSPGAVSPRAVSPRAGSPAAGSPAAGSPTAVPPAAGSPAALSPGAVSPAAVSPAAVSPAVSSPTACRRCARVLPAVDGIRFCPFCGVSQGLKPCPRCGTPREGGWSFCIQCGAGLAGVGDAP